MLGFVEEIVLLQLDDSQGKFVNLPLSAADVVLAGAALMELALSNRVDTDLRRLILVDPTPTGDDILDDVLKRLAETDGELNASTGLERISVNGEKYQEMALKRLIAKGVLREENGRFLWVFRTRRYPVVDDSEQREVRARLRQLLLTDEIPDPRDVVLLPDRRLRAAQARPQPRRDRPDKNPGRAAQPARSDRPGGDQSGRRNPLHRHSRRARLLSR